MWLLPRLQQTLGNRMQIVQDGKPAQASAAQLYLKPTNRPNLRPASARPASARVVIRGKTGAWHMELVYSGKNASRTLVKTI